jgi:DNA polymerase-3 subunit beta
MPGVQDGDWLSPVKPLIAGLRAQPATALVRIASTATLALNGTVYGHLDVGDWPGLAMGDLPHTATMPAGEMARLLSTCRHAMSDEQTRYYLIGVALQSRNGGLVAVATDGHRLALTRSTLDMPGLPDVIIPAPTVAAIIAACNGGGDARVEVSDTRIRVTVGAVTVASKLIDGTFPDYERVIPRDHDRLVTVDAGEMVAAVKRAMVAAPKGLGRPVKVAVNDGRMTVTGKDIAEGTKASADLPATGALHESGFQARYLLDAISAAASDRAEISTGDKGAPAILRAPGCDSTFFMIMPIRI